MTTRPEFRSFLRAQLDDPDFRQWSDADLDRYLDQSARKYSSYFPRVREQQFAADGINSRFDVPDDLLDDGISRVWLVRDGVSREIPGNVTRQREPAMGFEVIDQYLSLNFVPLATDLVRLRYAALYTIPADTVTDAVIPLEDEDAIYLWAEHLAWRKIGAADAALSRWKEDGTRDDSPIIPQYVHLERQYKKLIDEKFARGRFMVLKRTPRGGQITLT